MEIVNLSNPEMKLAKGRHTKRYIYFANDQITISKAACEEYGISEGLRISFVFDMDRLYFYVDYNIDGFPLTISGVTIRFYSSPLVHKIRKRYFALNNKEKMKFGLKPLPTKMNGCPLIEILIRSKI